MGGVNTAGYDFSVVSQVTFLFKAYSKMRYRLPTGHSMEPVYHLLSLR